MPSLRRRAPAAPGTEIIGLTPTFGAESGEGNFESYLAAVGVVDVVIRYEGEYHAGSATSSAGWARCWARSSESSRWTTSGIARAASAFSICTCRRRSRSTNRNGVNPQAVTAFVPSAAIALTLALVPMFERVAPFGWFIGAALGALAYYELTRGKPLFEGPLEETVAPPDQETAR